MIIRTDATQPSLRHASLQERQEITRQKPSYPSHSTSVAVLLVIWLMGSIALPLQSALQVESQLHSLAVAEYA